MKITHKTPPFQLWDWLKHHLSYTMTFCVIIGSLLTGNIFYAFFSRDIQISNAKIKTLTDTIEKQDEVIKEILTNEQMTHRYMAELKQLFVSRNDEEAKEVMDNLLKEIQEKK